MLIIRQAQSQADALCIHQLAEAIWWPTYKAYIPEDQIKQMLEDRYQPEVLMEALEREKGYFIAFRGETPVGFIHVAETALHPESMHLEKIYILPEEQGKGTGKALMQFAEQHVQSLGKTRLRLNVNRNNVLAKQFYERQGFHTIAEVDIPYRSYMLNDYIMEKVLI